MITTTMRCLLVGLYSLVLWPMHAFAQGVGEPTYHVDCAQGQSIFSALEKAKDGATIEVSGICTEAIFIQKDRIKLVGVDGAILRASSNPDFPVVNVAGNSVEIRNFEIQASGANTGIRLSRGGSASIIENNVINDADKDGIFLRSGSYAFIVNNDIVDSGRHGINVSLGSSSDIRDNTIEDAASTGIQIETGSSAELARNEILGGVFGININFASGANILDNVVRNTSSQGILVLGASGALINRNEVRDSGSVGISISGSSNAAIRDNTVTGGSGWGVAISNSSSAAVGGNTITGNSSTGVIIRNNSSLLFAGFAGGANTIEDNGFYGVRCEFSGALDYRVVQDFGTGNAPADGFVDPSCDLSNTTGVPFP